MALFAKACLNEFTKVTQRLEVTLGPDTSNLGLRIGLNSGPVTAGVLRGEKSRFQLFGDTVNTASRMESASFAGRMLCSQSTADCITEGGLSEWLDAREELVDVKGKGDYQTFWVTPYNEDDTASDAGSEEGNEFHVNRLKPMRVASSDGLWGDFDNQRDNTQNKRLVDWHVELLVGLLKQIVSHRSKKERFATYAPSTGAHVNPRDEVAEAIVMPEFDAKKASKYSDPDSIELHPNVVSQLHDYVTTLSCMYRGNPFVSSAPFLF